MAWTAPTIAEFKAYFVRDFNFAGDDDQSNLDKIVDADITRALVEAEFDFNTDFDDDNHTPFMYLVAFHLVENIRLSSKGLSAQAKFPISSTGVGGVSIGYEIPAQFANNAKINSFAVNGYGMKYLSLVLPQIIGIVKISEGTTTIG